MSSTLDRMSQDLKLDKEYIQKILKSSDFYYKSYTIPKAAGGTRLISQPSPELKTFQYWAVYNVLARLPASVGAFAYKKGDCIKKHAECHADAGFVFHTDIKNFFPSIHSEMLMKLITEIRPELEADGLWFDDLCENISKICFRKNSLCIGAVSSPKISNAVLFSFDEKMLEYCKKKKLRYSRYADDIYISSPSYIEAQLEKDVSAALCDCGFEMNKRKTWFSSKKHRRRITGLIITTDGKVSIGTEMRNKIKKMVYERIRHGSGDPEVLLGYLSFLRNIEPKAYNRLIVKYSGYCDGDVIEAIKNGVHE